MRSTRAIRDHTGPFITRCNAKSVSERPRPKKAHLLTEGPETKSKNGAEKRQERRTGVACEHHGSRPSNSQDGSSPILCLRP